MSRVKIAMIGVGDISGIYLENIHGMFKNEIELVGVCDLIDEKAKNAVEKYNIGKTYKTMHEAFADPEVQVVLNLTRPYEHFDVSKAALEAGKHVYSEKPLAATLEEGRALVKLAEEKNLLLGGAPDTFLGAGIQTCRHLIDNGFIGEPVGGSTFMICRGHESWHPDPAFYYKHGGGPMMDMGPYYLSALVNLYGRVESVTGFAKKSFAQRTITSEPKFGEVVDVEVPTWVNGILHFENGATVTIFTTFDVVYKTQARFEIYGSEGTLIVPDPNYFGGPIQLLRPQEGEFKEIPLMFKYKENSRALGLADMGASIANGTDFRASHMQTLHVLEIMEKIIMSSDQKTTLKIDSPFQRKAPLGAK